LCGAANATDGELVRASTILVVVQYSKKIARTACLINKN
jgi:hypothetical protein